MYRFISGNGHCRQVRHHSNQDVNATLRAATGAKLLLGMSVAPKSPTETAALVASSPQNIAAAVTLLEAENPLLIEHVLRGYIPLLQAADRVRKRAQLIKLIALPTLPIALPSARSRALTRFGMK